MQRWGISLTCLTVLAVSGCSPSTSQSPAPSLTPAVMVAPTNISTNALVQPSTCTGSFVAHTLDFSTEVQGEAVHLFDSNGSGVAVGDLNDDDQLDLVFANLDGPNTIFWNQGDFVFRKQTLDDSGSRAVNIVDVEGDNRLDIVFTYRGGAVGAWQNMGQEQFVRKPLPGVLAPAYSMAWGDLNGDNALDLVTGSYDAELAKRDPNRFLFGDGAGVFFYQRNATEYEPQRLATSAQALAIALPDLNNDGQLDILVGNDFDMLDQGWLRVNNNWVDAPNLDATSESTMSIDQGDVNNDGSAELFTTDMKPYGLGTSTIAEWLPLMATMRRIHPADDPQIMENMLQMRASNGELRNQAYGHGVDATGWSWGGKFGDLDNDGFLDLYVVNGMIAAELFEHLPNNELVEHNQALRNNGNGRFSSVTQWRLDSTLSGRGMSMADLNGDGRLDVVVNNLRAPAHVFENQLCGGTGLEVELRWPQSQNTRALGARMSLYTNVGTFHRDVRAGSGYLSGDPAQVHFGVPQQAVVQKLEINWPDGKVSVVEAPQAQTSIIVTR